MRYCSSASARLIELRFAIFVIDAELRIIIRYLEIIWTHTFRKNVTMIFRSQNFTTFPYVSVKYLVDPNSKASHREKCALIFRSASFPQGYEYLRVLVCALNFGTLLLRSNSVRVVCRSFKNIHNFNGTTDRLENDDREIRSVN